MVLHIEMYCELLPSGGGLYFAFTLLLDATRGKGVRGFVIIYYEGGVVSECVCEGFQVETNFV